MSDDERKELSRKLHYGLALAERRMLEEKALRNEDVIQGTSDGRLRLCRHGGYCARCMASHQKLKSIRNKYPF